MNWIEQGKQTVNETIKYMKELERIQEEKSKGRPRISWEEYALKLAEVAALRSQDPYLTVGACALGKDNQVIGMGYNGAPQNVEIDWSDRDERRKRVVHAEVNCLRFCFPNDIKLLAVTLFPCSSCLATIASYKVPLIIFRDFYDKDDFAPQLAKEFGIKFKQIK